MHKAATDTEQSVRAGDPADVAIPRLVARHGGKLHSLAIRFCGNADEADDLVQETFLNAYRKWHQFKGDSKPGTWLYTIAARACKRMHRRRVGEPASMLSLSQPLPAEGPVPDLPDSDDCPLDEAIRHESVRHMEAAIAGLPPQYRMPLVLKDIIGMPVNDVARVLELKPNTVKTRLHRARLAIRSQLQQHLPTRDAPSPAYSRRVCMDLLKAKQDALDRGVPMAMPADFCERCRAVFASMDLAADLCRDLGGDKLPERVRQRIASSIGDGTGERP